MQNLVMKNLSNSCSVVELLLFPLRRLAVVSLLLLLYLFSLPMVTLAQTNPAARTFAEAKIKPIRPFSRARALVIGVSDYQDDKIADLQYADDDAKAFARLLQEETAWKIAPEDIVLLTNERATYEKFLGELNRIIEQAGSKERLIIYFAGHGDVEVVSEKKTGFLLFHNAANTNYALGGACEVTTLNEALNRLVLEKEAEIVLITDACRSGNLSGSLAGSSFGGAEATTSVIAELFRNTIKILSCQPDQSSLEDKNLGGGRGLFSYYLEQGLAGAADQNENRFVSLLELERYLQDEVLAASNNQQLPFTSGRKTARLIRTTGDFIRAEPVVSAPPAVASPPQDSAVEKFLAFTQAIADQQLLEPAGRSAYHYYQTIGDSPQATALKITMKASLTDALQKDAQLALREYVTTPGRQLAKRWTDSKVYEQYPEYLRVAAEVFGVGNSFYPETMSRAHYFRGVNLRLKANQAKDSLLYRQALAEQEKALVLLPDAAHIYNEQGIIYLYLGNKQQELEAFKTAHELSPRWGLALSNLALAYQRRDSFQLAERLFKDAIALDTELSLSHFNLSRLYEATGETEKAITALKAAIDTPDPLTDALYNLARLYAYEKNFRNYPEAKRLYEDYLQEVPTDFYARLSLGTVYQKIEQYNKADSIYQALAMEDPENTYLLFQMAALAEAQQRYLPAIILWEKLLLINPNNNAARIRLTKAFAVTDQAEKAVSSLSQALENKKYSYTYIMSVSVFERLYERPDFRAVMSRFFPDEN